MRGWRNSIRLDPISATLQFLHHHLRHCCPLNSSLKKGRKGEHQSIKLIKSWYSMNIDSPARGLLEDVGFSAAHTCAENSSESPFMWCVCRPPRRFYIFIEPIWDAGKLCSNYVPHPCTHFEGQISLEHIVLTTPPPLRKLSPGGNHGFISETEIG